MQILDASLAKSLMPLLTAMGSFWSDLNKDPVINSYLYGRIRQYAQTYLNYIETVLTVNRQTCPVFHKEYWSALLLYKSKILTGKAAQLKYGGSAVYGTKYYYGQYLSDIVSASVDSALVSADFLVDNVVNPSLMLTSGTEFEIDALADVLVFTENPFDKLPSLPVYDNSGAVVDYVITLWFCNGNFDYDTLYRHWGALLDTPAKSSEFYKQFINASFDALTGVASAQDLVRIFSAVAGLPVAAGNETVTEIVSLPDKLVICTDKNAYVFKAGSTATVAVGDVLSAGDTLTDTMELVELTSDVDVSLITNHPEKWPGIGVGKEFVDSVYFSQLIFTNKILSTSWYVDGSYADLRFTIGGWPADVDLFWKTVRDSGQTLAQFLKHTADAPSQVNTPTTINPMGFVLENLFKNNIILVRLRPLLFGDEALRGMVFKNLRQHMPPGTTIIVFAAIDGVNETYDLSTIPCEAVMGVEIPLVDTFNIEDHCVETIEVQNTRGCD